MGSESALRRARQKAGLFIDELSMMTGIDPGYLSKVERGKGCPSLRTVQKLALALGKTVDELFPDKSGEDVY